MLTKKKSSINFIIIICIIITIIAFFIPNLKLFWMHSWFYKLWKIDLVLIQFLLYSFIHWNIIHLVFNSIFLYIFGNSIEIFIWKKNMIVFFIFSTIFSWLFLLFFSKIPTIWISWFAMALITFYTLRLYELKNPEYKWWITAIIINIWIWLNPQISFIWHFFWFLCWIIYYMIYKFFLKNKSLLWK